MRPILLAVFLVSASALADGPGMAPASGGGGLPLRSGIRLLIDRFHLFPAAKSEGPGGVFAPARQRLLHLTGDPDALVTLGDLAGSGDVKLKAAVEMNDVVLRAIAPDDRVKADDTRQRAAGDYRALDASGRPYQFRLGARLVW